MKDLRAKIVALVIGGATEGERAAARAALQRYDERNAYTAPESCSAYYSRNIDQNGSRIVVKVESNVVTPNYNGTAQEQAAWWDYRRNGEFYS